MPQLLNFSGLDSEPKAVLWPGGSLAHLGQTHYGENRWRVVMAHTRKFMFRVNAQESYRWLPLYLGHKNKYVLECYMTPWEYARINKEIWETHNQTKGDLGPYPERGTWYGPCWIFEGYPTLGAIESVVDAIRAGERYTEQEKAQAIIQAHEKEEAEELRIATESMLDALPLRVTDGKLSQTFYKHAEDQPEKYSAEDVLKMFPGLKAGANKTFTAGGPRRSNNASNLSR